MQSLHGATSQNTLNFNSQLEQATGLNPKELKYTHYEAPHDVVFIEVYQRLSVQ
jgi:hypothetical protein